MDDDAPSAKLVAVLLEAEGCEVRVVRSAEEALATVGSFAPRLAIVDLLLPLMSGLLLAQRLKANPETAGVALVAVTAFNGRASERMARDAGFAGYTRKPIDPGSFVAFLIDCLRGVG
ncbi:MAG TPA: response regulator [Polyangiaceae bacterium]|nr:response regulator [Polyangiaceae bacterium]